MLADICEIERGISFPRSVISDSLLDGYIACLRTTNIQEQVDWNNLIFVPEKFIKRKSQNIKRNDILISTANSKKLVGKVALIDDVKMGSTFGGFISLIRASSLVEPYFLYAFLNSTESQAKFSDLSFQTTSIANLSLKELSRLSIPLPTLPEQREIVKILREADRLRQLRARVDEENDKLALAIFHDIFGDFDEHSPYRKVKLEKNADIVSGITKGRNLAQYKTVTVPYLRVANVQAGYLDLSEIKTIDVYPDEVQKYRLQHSDVLLTEGGDFDKLGRGTIWEHDIPNCIHQNHVFRVRLNTEVILPLFFHYFLQTAYARMYFLRSAKRTTNLASINISQLRALPVPLPALSLQQHFVRAIQEVRSVLDTQRQVRLEIDCLLGSLLARAFTGELTKRYREENQAYLAQLAIERDHLLQEHSAITTDDLPIKIKKTGRLRAELSSSQLAIVRIVEQDNEYRTLQSIQAESNLPPNEIQRHLELLTQIGLIKAVGVAVAPGERNRVFFTTAYRAIQEADDVREADLAVLREVQK